VTVIPERYSPMVYAIFRMVFGLLFLMHGLQKLAAMFGGMPGFNGPVPLGTLLGVGGVIECITGTMILVGFLTAPAAFIASGMMAYAYFTQHFPRAPWPILNGGEPAVMNCFAFLYMASRGSGPWSLDSLRKRGGARRAG
jgi:putative oxidoreductase